MGAPPRSTAPRSRAPRSRRAGAWCPSGGVWGGAALAPQRRRWGSGPGSQLRTVTENRPREGNRGTLPKSTVVVPLLATHRSSVVVGHHPATAPRSAPPRQPTRRSSPLAAGSHGARPAAARPEREAHSWPLRPPLLALAAARQAHVASPSAGWCRTIRRSEFRRRALRGKRLSATVLSRCAFAGGVATRGCCSARCLSATVS